MKHLLFILSLCLFCRAFAQITLLNPGVTVDWYPDETCCTEDGNAALRTRAVGDNGETSFGIAVESLSRFDFKWSTSSEASYDKLTVFVDGVSCGELSGEYNRSFSDVSLSLPDTSRHEIVWTFSRDAFSGLGENCGWIWFDGLEELLESQNFEPEPNGDAKTCIFRFDVPWHLDREVRHEGGYAIRSRAMPEGGSNRFGIELPENRTTFTCWVKFSDCTIANSLTIDGPNGWQMLYAAEDTVAEWQEVSFTFDPGSRQNVSWTYEVEPHEELLSGDVCVWVRFAELDGYVVGRTASPVEVICDESGKETIREILEADRGVAVTTEDEYPWEVDSTTGDGDSVSLRSARGLQSGETSAISFTVIGEGELSLRWKGGTAGSFSYRVDTGEEISPAGSEEWTDLTFTLNGDKRHIATLTYSAARYEASPEDGAWVDSLRWSAPRGWDDPDEVKTPVVVSGTTVLDLRPSPRVLTDATALTRINCDPAWAAAETAVLSVNGVETAQFDSADTHSWQPGDWGRFNLQLLFRDASGEPVGDPLHVAYLVTPDFFPELEETTPAEEVAAVLREHADAKLAANITDVKLYAAYRNWVDGKGIDREAVRESLQAWLSYALDSVALISAAPEEGDLAIESLDPAGDAGRVDFTLKVKDVSVGPDALEENIRKVFGVEGATSLEDKTFSGENVEVKVAQPEAGKVRFTVIPKEDAAGEPPARFFFKVKMK